MRSLILLAVPVGFLALTACPVLGGGSISSTESATNCVDQDEADEAEGEDAADDDACENENEDGDTDEGDDTDDVEDTGGTGDTSTIEPATCPEEDCGPAMGMPNTLCPDGVNYSGPTGVCLLLDDGTCGWEVLSCP